MVSGQQNLSVVSYLYCNELRFSCSSTFPYLHVINWTSASLITNASELWRTDECRRQQTVTWHYLIRNQQLWQNKNKWTSWFLSCLCRGEPQDGLHHTRVRMDVHTARGRKDRVKLHPLGQRILPVSSFKIKQCADSLTLLFFAISIIFIGMTVAQQYF